MALHVEASIALVMRLCRTFDRAPSMTQEAAYMWLLTPAIKYWVCKRPRAFCMRRWSASAATAMSRRAFWRGITGIAGQRDLGRVRQCDVPRRAPACCARGRRGIRRVARTHRRNAAPAGGRRGGRFRQSFPPADSERVARLAVEIGAARRRRGAQRGVATACGSCLPPRALPGNHASMYGAVDLASADVAGLLERASALKVS